MGLIKSLVRLVIAKEETRPMDECIKNTQELIREQGEMQDRLDKVAATLDGEDGWFLTLEKRGKEVNLHV
jgi:hypothetical protein